MSTASIRHNGTKTRRACGQAANNATISGCPKAIRSCPSKIAASCAARRTSQPNSKGQTRSARATGTAAASDTSSTTRNDRAARVITCPA